MHVNRLCLEGALDIPFGGIKKSGIGRSNGEYGIREHTLIKTVFIADS